MQNKIFLITCTDWNYSVPLFLDFRGVCVREIGGQVEYRGEGRGEFFKGGKMGGNYTTMVNILQLKKG